MVKQKLPVLLSTIWLTLWLQVLQYHWVWQGSASELQRKKLIAKQLISISLIALCTWSISGIDFAFSTSSGSNKSPTLMYIEVMNSQILLGYWAKCKSESTYSGQLLPNARRFTFTQIPSPEPFLRPCLLYLFPIGFSLNSETPILSGIEITFHHFQSPYHYN